MNKIPKPAMKTLNDQEYWVRRLKSESNERVAQMTGMANHMQKLITKIKILQNEITYLGRWKGAHKTSRHGNRGGMRRMFYKNAVISLRKKSKKLKNVRESLIALKKEHENVRR